MSLLLKKYHVWHVMLLQSYLYSLLRAECSSGCVAWHNCILPVVDLSLQQLDLCTSERAACGSMATAGLEFFFFNILDIFGLGWVGIWECLMWNKNFLWLDEVWNKTSAD